jgi:CRISPR/Cas system CSM-associated protein Csm3 (group 7 of RAMP superfamily)
MENNKHTEYKMKYTHRYIARIVLEAKTPLVVGMGDKNIQTDAVVATDVNGLPYIPGSSIAGVLRHAIGEDSELGNSLFGMGDKKGKNGEITEEGHGSYLIFSEAKMVGKDGKALDGLQMIDWSDVFYSHFRHLPIRQHVRITEKGVAANTGKFDEQVVFKGTRFCFEMELVSDGENKGDFESLLNQMYSPAFRLGGGTRSGFGEMEIISKKSFENNDNDIRRGKGFDEMKIFSKKRYIDLTNNEDRNFYLDKSSNLSVDWEESSNSSDEYKPSSEEKDWTTYQLDLVLDDFFLFGSGLSDEDADMTPVKEPVIEWENDKPEFKENYILIPATSVKGALAHRVAYHYNKLAGNFAEDIEDAMSVTGKNNIAVKTLFGSEGEKTNGEMKDQARGNVIFSDVIKSLRLEEHIMPHVAIDRFTGGALDGALFQEKNIYGKGQHFTAKIAVNNSAIEDDKIKKALESSLQDICKGLLPLGGGVNRGNGCFSGTLTKNGEGNL